MISKSVDLSAVVLFMLLNIGIVVADVQIPLLRALMTIVLFGLLGYSTLMVWTPELASEGVMCILGTLALAFGLTAVIGFLLHFTHWGLQPLSWVVSMSFIILCHLSIISIRRGYLSLQSTSLGTMRFSTYQSFLMVLSAVIIILAIAIDRKGMLEQPSFKFTQLWMVPEDDGSLEHVRLGIRNEEDKMRSYRLEIAQGNRVIRLYPEVELNPGQQWDAVLDLQQLELPVDALLYLNDEPGEVYRSVTLK